jgi:hypothetical protein
MDAPVLSSQQPDKESKTKSVTLLLQEKTRRHVPEVSPPVITKCCTMSEGAKLKYLKFLEVLILISIVLLVTGLVLIPTVIYVLHSQSQVCQLLVTLPVWQPFLN